MKTVAQNLLLVIVTVLVCMGLGELVVRVFYNPPPLFDPVAAEQGLRKIIVFDDRLETRYRPGSSAVIRSQYGEFQITYEINELGLRDRPLPAQKGDGSHRILVLGNSLAEGWGVPAHRSFVRVAERHLAEGNCSKPAPRIVNAGVSGYGAAQAYLLFQELQEKVQPDAVVFVYVSTMVHFDHKYLARAETNRDGLATGLSVDALLKGGTSQGDNASDSTTVVSPPLRRLADYSALARLVLVSLIARAERRRITAGDPATDLLAGMRAEPSRLSALHNPSFRHVAAIANLAVKSGLPFVLVHLPLPHQVSAHAWGKGRTAYGLEEKVYDARDRLTVETFCQRARIHCVAAHGWLSQRTPGLAPSEALFFDYDFHPNEAGNAALGSWMAEQLLPLPPCR